MDLNGIGYICVNWIPVAGCFENGNEPSCSIEGG
jgi:hypothetical protein